MEEIDFESDDFADIVDKDDRYDARAYALLMDVIRYLGEGGGHMSSEDILDEFKERTNFFSNIGVTCTRKFQWKGNVIVDSRGA